MNATRWVTLTEFCKNLGRAGIARVDETEKGWFIAWIDNSPKALAKQVLSYIIFFCFCRSLIIQEATMKKERATMNDEQRERMLISEQIERAAAEKDEPSSSTPPREEGLKRDECAEKVVLSFAPKPKPEPEASTSAPAGGLKLSGLKSGINPLKRPNVFKTAATPKGSSLAEESAKTSEKNDKKRSAPISMAEKLILEDQERKRRRMDRDNTRS